MNLSDQRSHIDVRDLLSRPFEPPAFLLYPLIPEGAMVLITGDTASGKTSLAIHIALTIATGGLALDRFPTKRSGVFYVNREMGSNAVQRYVREAASKQTISDLPEDWLVFDGPEGFSVFKFWENPTYLIEKVRELRPSLVIFDSQRLALINRENDAEVVTQAFDWIRTELVQPLGMSAIVLHHLRKEGSVSNSARERVSGSSAISGQADVHLAALARPGKFMHALRIEKNRWPTPGALEGTVWPVKARLEFGEGDNPNRSILVAGDPKSMGLAGNSSGEETKAAVKILAMLADGPTPRVKLGLSDGGATRRAYDALKASGDIKVVQTIGRRQIIGLSSQSIGSTSLNQ